MEEEPDKSFQQKKKVRIAGEKKKIWFKRDILIWYVFLMVACEIIIHILRPKNYSYISNCAEMMISRDKSSAVPDMGN